MSEKQTDFGIITESGEMRRRCMGICEESEYVFEHFRDIGTFMEEKRDFKFLVATIKPGDGPAQAAEIAQAVRFACAEAFVACIAPKTLPKEAAGFARKSGANLILLEDEVHNSSKLEFVASQVIRANFVPVKVQDLDTRRPISFDLYHLLPQRRKFLCFLFSGDTLDEARLRKLSSAGELYIHRRDTKAFKDYVALTSDGSAAGLAKRCRAQFLDLSTVYAEMVFDLTDQSACSTPAEGERLLKRCRDLCAELLGSLAALGSAWEIINNSAVGEFGPLERAPAVACYAAQFALQAGIDNIDKIMLASLLCDLGLIFMPAGITKKLREDTLSELTGPERALLNTYPQLTLSALLSRRLSLDEKLRNVILCIQERADGTGFPKQLLGGRIPTEAQLIHFCKEFDQKSVVRLGRPRREQGVVREELISEDYGVYRKFTPSFLDRMKATFPDKDS